MTVTTFISPDNTCTSSTVGDGSIYVYPTLEEKWSKSSVSFYLSANGDVSGVIGSLYDNDFYPYAYVYYSSAIGSSGGLSATGSNIGIDSTEFPLSLVIAHHPSFKTPCLRLDGSGVSVTISAKSG
jgi:hypothetical protein